MHGADGLTRRRFLGTAAATLCATAAMPALAGQVRPALRRASSESGLFRISLAQWSFHRALRSGRMDTAGFVRTARRECRIGAVEFVNTFLRDQIADAAWRLDLRILAADENVRLLLIMCDSEGHLGDPDEAARRTAVANHRRWLDAAKEFGCHSIRVNAASAGARTEQERLAADGLRRLCELADPLDLNVLVENHGGLSSDGSWLAAVIRRVDHPRCGTLPDFGNFQLGDGAEYDRYRGVDELMPFARAVSAKSHSFDAEGNERSTDFRRMLRIVLRHGYRGWIGIEYEGSDPDELAGVRRTRDLLERVRAEIAADPAFAPAVPPGDPGTQPWGDGEGRP